MTDQCRTLTSRGALGALSGASVIGKATAMTPRVRTRFSVEAGGALASAVLAVSR